MHPAPASPASRSSPAARSSPNRCALSKPPTSTACSWWDASTARWPDGRGRTRCAQSLRHCGRGIRRPPRRAADGRDCGAGRPVVFTGLGGREMAERGLDSLVPIADLAVNGFAAIPARLPTILRHLRTASRAVIAARPDALVIIDSPDFTHRVARRVRAAVPSIPIIDYVSPTVWAWRPGRAKAMRRYVDHVLALKPFEPAAHQRLGGPPCTYVGHPLIEQLATLRPDPSEAQRRRSDPPLVLVLPGSRKTEIRRLTGIFGAAIGQIADRVGPIELVLPTLPHLSETLRSAS